MYYNSLQNGYTRRYTKNYFQSHLKRVKYTYSLLKTAVKAPQGELSQVQPDSRSLQTIFRLDAGPVLKMLFAERYECFYRDLRRFWHSQNCDPLCFDLSFLVFVSLFRVEFFPNLFFLNLFFVNQFAKNSELVPYSVDPAGLYFTSPPASTPGYLSSD